ncbi:MAG: hypothetical protein AB7I30_05400 [Isosphaeraceae bacterium]
MRRDRLGRRRMPNQERGLRPLNPVLPDHWMSKAIRVAMSEHDWERFESMVRTLAAESPELAATLARAHGEVLSRLLDASEECRRDPGPLDWMDWERQKTLRLLRVRTAV